MQRLPIILLAAAALTIAPMALGLSATTDDIDHPELPMSHIPADASIERDPVTGETTVTLATSSNDPSDIGQLLGPFEGEEPMVNLAVLPGGRIMYYSGIESDQDGDGDTDLQFMWQSHPEQGKSRLMDLTVNEDGEAVYTIQTPNPEDGGHHDLFCSGTTVAPDGTVVTTGATEYHTLDDDFPENTYAPLLGMDQTLLFDSEGAGTWTQGPDMDANRWYPSAIQLPDGRTMVLSGIDTLFMPQTHNSLVETFDPAEPEAGWTSMDTSIAGLDTDGSLDDAPETGIRWIDNIHDEVPNLPMYPRVFVVPSGPHEGEVFYSTAGDYWGPFGEHPVEGIWNNLQTLDTETGEWTLHGPSVFGGRQLGTTVPLIYDHADDYAAHYLTFGGTLQRVLTATSTAEIVDASGEELTKDAVEPMHLPRWSHNGVLLPDGSVLAVGGSTFDNVVMHGAPTMSPHNLERYIPGDEDPAEGHWELLAPLENPRAYHSSSALLPDGRVLIGGHVPLPAFHHQQRENGNPQPYDSTFELYEPPYLHLDGTRPVITAEGFEDEAYGGTIDVPVENLEGSAEVVLIRPGATTHGFDADQRGVSLEITKRVDNPTETVLTVQLPPNANVAPPGSYMLFVNEDVDGEAMPSEAAWLEIG